MAKHKRKVWEELLEVGRRIVKELDDILAPRAPQRPSPAPVPVPAEKRRKRFDNR